MLSPTTIRELLDLQGRVKADVIFLSESHLNTAKATELRVKRCPEFKSFMRLKLVVCYKITGMHY